LQPSQLFNYHLMPVLLSSQFCFFKCQLAGWAKKILIIVNTKYPSELRGAVHQFLQVCSRILCFSLLAIIARISESLDGLNLFNFNRITKPNLRKMIHCIRFYARCWMGIWIHHLISQSQNFGLPCIIQRYHPFTFIEYSLSIILKCVFSCSIVFNFLLLHTSFILICCAIGWC
jgi:hypothetical protein